MIIHSRPEFYMAGKNWESTALSMGWMWKENHMQFPCWSDPGRGLVLQCSLSSSVQVEMLTECAQSTKI